MQLLPSFTHSGYDYFCTLEPLSSSSTIRTSTFLFVELRFRYLFLSPLPHDSQTWKSLLGSPVAGAHRGLASHKQHARSKQKTSTFVLAFVYKLLIKVSLRQL